MCIINPITSAYYGFTIRILLTKNYFIEMYLDKSVHDAAWLQNNNILVLFVLSLIINFMKHYNNTEHYIYLTLSKSKQIMMNKEYHKLVNTKHVF